MNIQPDKVSALIREAAEKEILPRFKSLKSNEISEKGPGDIVTAADMEAEKLLSRELCALLPGSLALGEEAVSSGATSLSLLEGSNPVWVIDPVDGTQNFADGKDHFAVIVALCQQGKILAGWIHDPLSGDTAIAEKGAGAWLNGKAMRTAKADSVSKMVGPLWGRMIKQLKSQVKEGWGEMPKQVKHYGCVAHEYLDMAKGKLHFSLYGRLKPWDHAAGVLLHQEAGGYSALMTGKSPYQALEISGNRLLLAPDEESWQRLNKLFKGK